MPPARKHPARKHNSAARERAADTGEEVAVVGEVTREERDKLGRKHAIDLEEAGTPCKRRKVDVEAQVVIARSICSAANDARYKQLIQALAPPGTAPMVCDEAVCASLWYRQLLRLWLLLLLLLLQLLCCYY